MAFGLTRDQHRRVGRTVRRFEHGARRGRKQRQRRVGSAGDSAPGPTTGGVAYLNNMVPAASIVDWDDLTADQKADFSANQQTFYNANGGSVLAPGIADAYLCTTTLVDPPVDGAEAVYAIEMEDAQTPRRVVVFNTVTQSIPVGHFVQLKNLELIDDTYQGIIDVANCQAV